MACLVYSDNSGRQLVYTLDGERVSIGRSPANDVVLPDLRISRHHASIMRAADGASFVIRDEGSSMGVFVNQQRVTETKLCDGDVIRPGADDREFLQAFVNYAAI